MSGYDLSNLIVQKILAINRIHVAPLQRVYRNNRERDAVAIKTSGRTIYTSHETTYLSDAQHIVILPKGSSYHWMCSEAGECLMIEFEANVEAVWRELHAFHVPHHTEYLNIFTRIEPFWLFKKAAYHLKCIAGLYELLAKLADADMPDTQLTDKADIIAPSLRYLEEHYNDPALCNDKLARISGISTVYFRKLFTGIYNTSPMKYIQHIRVEKAKDMLLSDYYTVTNIAEAVGFGSVYHFCKTFKKTTGSTPSEFTRRNSVMRQP